MHVLTRDDRHRLSEALLPGEQVLWSGGPEQRIVLHDADWIAIPFSLFWTGAAITWTSGLNLRSGQLLGWLCVLVGQYLVWGRFLMTAWLKAGRVYAVTDLRVLTVAHRPRPIVLSAFHKDGGFLRQEIRRDGSGTLQFGPEPVRGAVGRAWDIFRTGLALDGASPIFRDVAEAGRVAALVADLREHALREVMLNPQRSPDSRESF